MLLKISVVAALVAGATAQATAPQWGQVCAYILSTFPFSTYAAILRSAGVKDGQVQRFARPDGFVR